MARKRLSTVTNYRLDPCDQDRSNVIKDELTCRQNQNTVSSDRVVPAQTPPRLPTTADKLSGTGTPTVVNISSRLQGPKYREGVAKISDNSKLLLGTKLCRSNRLINKFKCVILSFMFI